MAVTTLESSEGIREKATRNASIDDLETGRSTARRSSPGGSESDNEIVTPLVDIITKEGDNVVASDSKSKLWRDLTFKASNTTLEHERCRHCEGSRVSDKSVHQQ